MSFCRFIPFLMVLVLVSCTPQMDPIDFGSDTCSYCKMRIVDQKFGAEIVTSKGKVYKYDALECLVHHELEAEDFQPSDIQLRFTIDYHHVGELIPLETAHVLYCTEIPSPMGMYLSTFSTEADMKNALGNLEGREMSLTEVKQHVIENVPWE